MPKKKIGKPQREMTHRQLTHWQKEKRLQRIVVIAGIGIIIAIIAIIGTGFYMAKYRPAHQVVLKIGNTEYDMDYLIKTLVSYNIKGVDPNQQSTYVNIAVQSIEQSQLIVEAAASLNPPITVSEDNITKYITDNGLTKDKITHDGVRRQLLTEKLKTDYFSPQIPATAEQRAVRAMLLENQAQVNLVKTSITGGESFTDIAAIKSTDQITKDKKGDLGWLPKGVLSTVLTNNSNTASLEDAIFQAKKNELVTFEDNSTKNPGYWLLKVTETRESETQAHIYAMLLGSSKEAQDIGIRLATGGDGNDWDSQAKANSQYKDAATNGGDLGFVSKGTLGDVVDGAVFNSDGKVTLGLNNVIGPLEDPSQTTKNPVWLIQVYGIEERVISETDRTTLINAKAGDWFQTYFTAHKDEIKDLFNPSLQEYAISEAMKR